MKKSVEECTCQNRVATYVFRFLQSCRLRELRPHITSQFPFFLSLLAKNFGTEVDHTNFDLILVKEKASERYENVCT